MEEESNEISNARPESPDLFTKSKKKKKPGIIYLSTLPPYMNVTKVKEIFSLYGELGRVFLQPVESKSGPKHRRKPAIHYSEGWIEFKSKRVAKAVALNLNNTHVGGKKSSKFYDYLWNIKYLPRFKWIHLSERLAYERAVHRQKLRAEIAQAKREANFFAHNLDKSKKFNRNKNIAVNNEFKVKKTESEILSARSYNVDEKSDRKEFLKSLFAKS